MERFRTAVCAALPDDAHDATLAARIWRPELDGPSVAAIRAGLVIDVTRNFPTLRDLCEASDPAAALRGAAGDRVGNVADILANTPVDVRDRSKPWFLAPADLQAVKAAGVTFAVSMLERVIEERARGDNAAAAAIRAEVNRMVGDDLPRLKPGSREAMRLKELLIQ